jgi:hypothetical protein
VTTTTLAPGPLLDVGAMDAVLRPVLGARLASAELVGGKPGHRRVVRYRGGGVEVYGKAYGDGAAAARTWDLLCRLAGVVTAPRPLLHVQDRALVLYAPVPGRPLDALVATAAAAQGMEDAGRWLAALHGVGVELDRTLDLGHEGANAVLWADLVADRDPAVGAVVAAVARALGPPPSMQDRVLLHKDFHYQHVLVGDGTGAIDFDEARMGDPAFDVAHFCAYLDLLGLRHGVAADGWKDAFLRGYGVPVEEASLRWCRLYTVLKMAKQLATGRGPAPVPAGEARRAEITAVLSLARPGGG